MLARPEPPSGSLTASPLAIWLTSAVFSVGVLAGYRSLEQREYLPVVVVLALVHLLTVVRCAPAASRHLFLSQTCVVAATLISVVLHVSFVVGPAPEGLERALFSFLVASFTSPDNYFLLAAYLAVFCFVLAGLVVAVRVLRLRPAVDVTSTLVMAYTLSSVNVAFDYSVWRPLYHVSGEPEAKIFYYAVGLFGVETALTMHLLFFGLCLLWTRRAHRLSERPLGGR